MQSSFCVRRTLLRAAVGLLPSPTWGYRHSSAEATSDTGLDTERDLRVVRNDLMIPPGIPRIAHVATAHSHVTQ